MLDPRPGLLYIDGTLGAGGHARALLSAGADIVLAAFDRDPDAVRLAGENLREFQNRLSIINADFRRWRDYALPALPLGGCLLDLGLSSMQIDSSGRGFSFSRDEPLDMRMDPREGPTAADLLNESSLEGLERIFREQGEVPFWRRLAREVLARRRERPFARTGDLLDVVRSVAGRGRRSHNPATLPFMALRIEVNRELEGLDVCLREFAAALAPRGRLVVIAFHSLEDRIVKRTFRHIADADSGYSLLTKKPLVPGADECARNPRARSARLRALAREPRPERPRKYARRQELAS